MTRRYNKILSIAGSDSGGGAGIQADLKAIAACGGYGMTAITALTAQNTVGVQEVFPIPPRFIKRQLTSIFEDMGADAIKIGMLHNSEVVEVVKQALTDYKVEKIILDPVMVATSGDVLLEKEAINSLKKRLIPITSLVTPNIHEAEILLDNTIKIKDEKTMNEAVKLLGDNFGVPMLLKGGHVDGNHIIDLLYQPETEQIQTFLFPKVHTKNTHGTGCTLSSAIATYYAQYEDLFVATEQARKYLQEALINGADIELGKGSGPVHHFYGFWQGGIQG